MPKCSVIVVNFNGKHFLSECLNSLDRQSFRDFETIFVDNGSSDHSSDFVRERYPQVRIITLERNLGFCAGNNIAIRHSHAEFVALLNNDTKTEPDWLKELIQAAVGDPKVGICASRILNMAQPDVIYSAGDCYAPDGVAFRRGEGMPAAGRFEEAEEVFSACACAALYRRSMLDEIGLFEEDFFSNYEDVDLAFRGRIAGYSCLYVPTSIVYHHGSGTAGIGNPRVEFLGSRNSEYLYFRNMPTILLLKYLPLHVVNVLWGFRVRLGTDCMRPYVKGKIAFLGSLWKVMTKRPAIQRQQRVSIPQLTQTMDRAAVLRKLRENAGILLGRTSYSDGRSL